MQTNQADSVTLERARKRALMLDEDDIDEFVNSRGDVVLFFAENPTQLPESNDVAMILPETEAVQGQHAALDLLRALLSQLEGYRADLPAAQLDLGTLDRADRDFVDQVLGEGEVSVIFTGDLEARIQESVLTGVWRVKYPERDDSLSQDVIEVGAIPRMVSESTFAHAADKAAALSENIPEGVLNAPPLLAEINDKLGAYAIGYPAHVINLTLLPQTEQDLAFLAERLGRGGVSILSRGYGNCRITSTGTRHVWWVQYFDSQDRNILNSLEIAQVPNVACAAPEDIRESADRLREILELYR